METVAAGVEVGVGGWSEVEVRRVKCGGCNRVRGGVEWGEVSCDVGACFTLPSVPPPCHVHCTHTHFMFTCHTQLAEGRDEGERKHMSVDEVSKLIEELARLH